MRTVSFYKWSQKISITAYCDVGKIENTNCAENIWKRMAEKTRRIDTTTVEEHPLPSVEIVYPLREAISVSQNPIVVVEIVKFQGKKRLVERLEGSEEEIRKLMQGKQQPAQMLLF